MISPKYRIPGALTLIMGALAILLSACQEMGVFNSSAPPAPTEIEVTVRGQADGAPNGCTPEHVAERLQGLFDAVSTSDPDVVPEYFGTFDGDHTRANTGIAFQWFCMDTTTVYDLPELETYFNERYEQNEQLRLRSITLNGWEPARGIIHFGPVAVDRQADDLGDEWQTFTGKGAYYCENQTFHILCMGIGE
jgi:hypothetical protein